MADSTRRHTRPGLVVRVGLVLAGAVVIWSLMIWAGSTISGGVATITGRMVNAAIVFGLAVPLVVAARRTLDRRPWPGLRVQAWSGAWRPFLVGAAAFLIPSAVGLTVALLAGWVRVAFAFSPLELVGWIGLLVVSVLLSEAFPEELIFRGHIQRNLSAVIPPWAAALLQATLFACFATAVWVASAGWGVFLERATIFLTMGIVLGVLRVISDSVWTCVGFHLAFQVVAQFLLGPGVTTDSESVLTLAAIVTAFVLATTIVGWFTPHQPNWTRPEPDQPALSEASTSTRTP